MTIDPAPRPTFYQGQYLGPEDLDATVRYSADHAARHTLGAHTWGVGTGLAVVVSQSSSVEYWVQPGVAWDGFGRTLLVPAPVKITPDHLRSQVYDPVNDAPSGPGQLVDVWLRFREDATTPPSPGYDECADGRFSRAIERVDIVARNFADELDTQQLLDVGGLAVPPRHALGAWYPTATNPKPTIEDGSIAFQRFPGPAEASRWLVPIGVVRWKVAAPGSLGGVGNFEIPQPGDAAITRQRRRLVGVVAGTVLGAEGLLRLRPRAMPAPTVWTDEPLWLESTARLDGDLRLYGGPDQRERGGIDFRDGLGATAGRTIRISRHERAATSDLRVQLGPTGAAATRLVVGTEGPGPTPPDPPVFADSVVVTSDGRVGIGIPAPSVGPTHPLHVTSPLGVRQGSLHLSGGAGWSSVSYNAHHSEDNGKWVAPDPLRASSTIELDDAGGNPRFGVYTAPATNVVDTDPAWKLGIHLDGPTNHVGLGGEAGPANVVVHGVGDTSLTLSPSGAGAGPATTFGVGSAGAFVSTGLADLSLRTSALDRMTVKSDGRVGIGTPAPEATLHVSGEPTDIIAANLGAHVAIIENRSTTPDADVLALRVGTAANQVGEGNNFITFFAGTQAIGRIEQQTQSNGTKALRLASGAADFAESMPAAVGEDLAPGDVVAVVAGRATRATGNASWISVVTDRAIVLGNAPPTPTPDDVAITMLGQVPVRVRGETRTGDLLVPSGENDGTAIAYSPAVLPVECANQAFAEVVSVDSSAAESVTAIVGAHARSAALIAIVQRLHARAG